MNKYIDIIKEKNPCISIEKFSSNNEGQNNDIVIINDEYIFKFPKYSMGIEKLKKETGILNILNRYITLDMPDPIYSNFDSNEVGCVYSGYRMIKGISFRRDIFLGCKDKGVISQQLATFLRELHNIPLQEVAHCDLHAGDAYDEWSSLLERIEIKLFPFMKSESREAVSRNFNSFLEKNINFDKAIVHGDFGPSNILYDLNCGRISGIIDFNEVSIGDPAIDIASLMGPFGYGEDFVRSFQPIYPGIEELINRARFYASTFALQEALFGIEVGDSEAFNAGIKDYI